MEENEEDKKKYYFLYYYRYSYTVYEDRFFWFKKTQKEGFGRLIVRSSKKKFTCKLIKQTEHELQEQLLKENKDIISATIVTASISYLGYGTDNELT